MRSITKLLIILCVAIISWPTVRAAETDSEAAVNALINRIGGAGAANRFAIVIDAKMSADGRDVFTITAADGKPCIKGNSTLAVTTGLNWYLNHYAHINLAWNALTTDLTTSTLPVPTKAETHTCMADYRYYLNYCTFSYSMSVWTWERWQQEIDWMALHGINMPLQIVGLDVVWRRLLTEKYGYTKAEADAFIAGPCFQAWWGMNNLEGWGGPNPDWWYERQTWLAKQITDRMRQLGMQPVLPGFCGMVPSTFTAKTGIAANNQGGWCGFQRPFILDPSKQAFREVAKNYYAILKEVMGTSTYYSMDPFHEGANTQGIDVDGAYAAIYETMKAANDDIDEKWVIQYWQWSSAQYKVLSHVNKGDLIVLDLFSDAHTHFGEYRGHDAVYCMLDNFGGRTGFFGRLNGVINGFFQQRAQHANIKGIGATPEAIEQVPVIYDALFELPWCSTKPDARQWLADYAVSRYGTASANAAEAWELLRNASLNCTSGLQGPMEGVVCARPNLTVGSVSSWGGTGIFYDAQDVARAAALLLDADLSGENYSYDVTELTRQALTDCSYYLLQGINSAWQAKDTKAYEARKAAFLQLILDIDELLGTNENFMLGRWTQMARHIADEAEGTTEADRQWLELNNARTLITTWGDRQQANGGGLRDYSYRMWQGIMRDYYYPRWKYFFDNNCQGKDWFTDEWAWAHDATKTYSDVPQGDSKTTARRLFANHFLPVAIGSGKTYMAYRTLTTDLTTAYCPEAYRGEAFSMNLQIPDGAKATLAIDLNGDGMMAADETFGTTDVQIPAASVTGSVKATLSLDDGTQIAFSLILKDHITTPRTVRVQAAQAGQGTVRIDGTSQKEVTTTEAVTITATPASGYDFIGWTDQEGRTVSTANTYIYYGAAEATFTAHFAINKWGVPAADTSDMGDIRSYSQYLSAITLTQYGETSTLYTASACPDNLYNALSTPVTAAPGGTFTLDWQDAGGMAYTYLSAYLDLNADGTFSMKDELLGVRGTFNSTSQAPCSGPLKVTLPFDMPEGITHLRLRFDGAWKTNYDATTKAFPAAGTLNRMCYEIMVNVLPAAQKAVTVTVKTSNSARGTVDANGQPETYTYAPGEEVILRAYPKAGYRIDYWRDQNGRRLPAAWMEENMIKFRPYDNATISAVFTVDTGIATATTADARQMRRYDLSGRPVSPSALTKGPGLFVTSLGEKKIVR